MSVRIANPECLKVNEHTEGNHRHGVQRCRCAFDHGVNVSSTQKKRWHYEPGRRQAGESPGDQREGEEDTKAPFHEWTQGGSGGQRRTVIRQSCRPRSPGTRGSARMRCSASSFNLVVSLSHSIVTPMLATTPHATTNEAIQYTQNRPALIRHCS